ncbi:hypothetical protein ECANGB1_1274 [Enterospora canceri]|uniref:Uncharacterized protein n=1 Tax=Enterospora canceri TaxID=1081671 RepID=A0A1Y1S6I8_9MICR|nr:hypothetical protein ECANGB1_1274 [Enterospora canceri]
MKKTYRPLKRIIENVERYKNKVVDMESMLKIKRDADGIENIDEYWSAAGKILETSQVMGTEECVKMLEENNKCMNDDKHKLETNKVDESIRKPLSMDGIEFSAETVDLQNAFIKTSIIKEETDCSDLEAGAIKEQIKIKDSEEFVIPKYIEDEVDNEIDFGDEFGHNVSVQNDALEDETIHIAANHVEPDNFDKSDTQNSQLKNEKQEENKMARMKLTRPRKTPVKKRVRDSPKKAAKKTAIKTRKTKAVSGVQRKQKRLIRPLPSISKSILNNSLDATPRKTAPKTTVSNCFKVVKISSDFKNAILYLEQEAYTHMHTAETNMTFFVEKGTVAATINNKEHSYKSEESFTVDKNDRYKVTGKSQGGTTLNVVYLR